MSYEGSGEEFLFGAAFVWLVLGTSMGLALLTVVGVAVVIGIVAVAVMYVGGIEV